MTGLQRTFGKFIIFLLTIFMANVFGSAMCFFIAASIPVFGKMSRKNIFFIIITFFSRGFNRFGSCFCDYDGLQWFLG
jgi:hypothetical protein